MLRFSFYIWRFPNDWGYLNSWMVYFMDIPIKIDDLGVPT